MTRRQLAVALVAAGGLVAWAILGTGSAPGGMPRLAVDRTEIDLGAFRFDAPARAVFGLRNEGDGVLEIVDRPPVKALQGC